MRVLDFDLAKVIEQSRDNPVFYVQYGHARGHSIFRNAREEIPDLPTTMRRRARTLLAEATFARLEDPAELALMRRIALYPRLVEAAAVAHEPHRIAFYLYELASEFHALWTKGKDSPHLRFIIQNDPETDDGSARAGAGRRDGACFRARFARGRRARWRCGEARRRRSRSSLRLTGRHRAAHGWRQRGCGERNVRRRVFSSSRPSPPHGDAAEHRDSAPDPLMELARLIGQSDPFGTPPGRGTDSPRAPELPTRGPMARPPSRANPPRAERQEEKHALRGRAGATRKSRAYEPRPARGHPFPWLQVPPAPAPAVSREPSQADRSHEQARETAYREAAYREPPPYSEPPLTAAPAAHSAYAQPAPGGYEL